MTTIQHLNLIRISTENTIPSTNEGAERHYMTVSIASGEPKVSFECRHAESDGMCLGAAAEEIGIGILSHMDADEDAEIRSGLIDIWVDGDDILWSYVVFTRPPRGRTVATNYDRKIAIETVGTNVEVTASLDDLPQVALYHGNEISRMLSIGQKGVDRRHGGNVDFYNEGYYAHQLLEAVAALRFFAAGGAGTPVDEPPF